MLVVLSFKKLKDRIVIHIILLTELMLFDFNNIKKPTLCLKCRHRLKQNVADQAIPRRQQHLVIANTNLSRRIVIRPAEREDVNGKQIQNSRRTCELIVEISLNVLLAK